MHKLFYKYFIFFLIFASTSNSICAQYRIGQSVGISGKLENSIKNKTLVFYAVNDIYGGDKIIRRLKKEGGVSVISANKLFFPKGNEGDYIWSNSEIKQYLIDNNIETILLIKMNSDLKYNPFKPKTFFDSLTDSFKYNKKSIKVFKYSTLLFEIYNSDDNYCKPVASLNTRIKKTSLNENDFKKRKTKKSMKKNRKIIFQKSKFVFELMKEFKAFD